MEARRAPQPSYPFQLSLRVRHPSIDPAAISRELQIEPEHSFRAGEPRDPSRSLAVAPVHVDSYWLATLDLEKLLVGTPETALVHEITRHTQTIATSLEPALTILTASVLRRHAEFFRRIQSEGGEVRLIVAISARKTRGFTLTPHLSRALSELRIPVDFELGHR
ncbi:MAG TPA: hypothetical protein VN705_23600 [Steroidobacteraceae bacterium]|jgi:hypothetical protein|nr:hypothetical protein [Steroidobacteraceae bacterium]